MKNFKVKAVGAIALLGVIFGTALPANTVQAAEQTVKVEKQIVPEIPKMYSTNEYIVAHESGNPNNAGANSVYNEVAYMKNNWQNAFVTHWVGSGGKVIQIANSGYASWGAGPNINYRTYAQVELARTNSEATFKKDYVAYVTLLRQLAKEAGLPQRLDAGKGIVTHAFVANNFGGTDHQDPISYLNKWGVSLTEFSKDIKTGISSTNDVPENNTGNNSGNKPAPVNPVKPATGNTVKKSGTYTVKVDTNVRNAPSTSSAVAAVYSKGSSFNYDQKVVKNGYTWLSYISYSGVRRYVAMLDSNGNAISASSNAEQSGKIKQSGTFCMNSTINIRTGAGTNYRSVGQYYTGQSVNYSGTVNADGYIWVKYKAYSGSTRYVAVGTSASNIWGTIK